VHTCLNLSVLFTNPLSADQAVKTLSEIWHPEDIPGVFIGPPSLSNSAKQQPSLVSADAETNNPVLPIKNFVHDNPARPVLLCKQHLEAIRSKVPEILWDEKLGIRSYFMPESTILPATEAELQMDKNLSNSEPLPPLETSDDPFCVRVAHSWRPSSRTSDRAWAKLSGLPPREIGRCKRALGQALDWVGKKTKDVVTSPAGTSRTVIRT
jgi:hypothetical protein